MKRNKKFIALAMIMSVAVMGVSCKSVKELGTVGDVSYYRVNARTFDGPNITALVERTGDHVTASGQVVASCSPSRSSIVATASGPGIGHTVVAAVGGIAEAFIMKDAFGSATVINNAVSSVADAASSSAGGNATGGRGGNATGGSASNNNSNVANGGAGGAGGSSSSTATGGAGGSATSTSSGGGNGGGNGGGGNININVNQNQNQNQNQGDCRPNRPGC